MSAEKNHPWAYEELLKKWDGREPTWQEFIEASKAGRVQVNKTVAAYAIMSPQVSNPFRLIYGVILNLVWLLFVPVIIVLAVFNVASWWWVVGSFLGAWFFKSVAREGHCEGIKDAAEKHEDFYKNLIRAGAFVFKKENDV